MAMNVKPIKDLVQDERGGPLAEMAVLLLPFILIIAMVIEGGNILWRHQIALKATRDTTRYMSRVPLLFSDDCVLNQGVFSDAKTTAKTLGVTGLLSGGPPLIVNWTEANIDVVSSVATVDPCFAVVQTTASVELPLPFAPVFRLFDPEQGDSITFSVADRARWSGE